MACLPRGKAQWKGRTWKSTQNKLIHFLVCISVVTCRARHCSLNNFIFQVTVRIEMISHEPEGASDRVYEKRIGVRKQTSHPPTLSNRNMDMRLIISTVQFQDVQPIKTCTYKHS